MGRKDWTDIGGAGATFLTTHWSLIDGVCRDQDEDRALIGLLLERYWKPVYCYLRGKGCDNEQAKDLTQGFLHEVVLDRRLIERAEPSKGRFRALLLHALNQYLVDERRKESALKRIPREKLVPLEIVEPPVLAASVSVLDAEESFNHAWKADLLDRVLAEVRDSYLSRGMEAHWFVFRDRLARPILKDLEAPSLSDLCARYGIESVVAASNMLKTVKRRFQSTLRKHVRRTLVSGKLVEEEMQEIFRFLQKKGTE
jgi:RNA polymerase sigma-70 factor (ECF subfamily)